MSIGARAVRPAIEHASGAGIDSKAAPGDRGATKDARGEGGGAPSSRIAARVSSPPVGPEWGTSHLTGRTGVRYLFVACQRGPRGAPY